MQVRGWKGNYHIIITWDYGRGVFNSPLRQSSDIFRRTFIYLLVIMLGNVIIIYYLKRIPADFNQMVPLILRHKPGNKLCCNTTHHIFLLRYLYAKSEEMLHFAAFLLFKSFIFHGILKVQNFISVSSLYQLKVFVTIFLILHIT